MHDVCFEEFGGSCKTANRAAVRQGDWKLIVQHGEETLYNIAEDPGETTDLSKIRPAQLAQMRQFLASAQATTVPANDLEAIDPQSDPRRHRGAWVPWQGE